MFTTCLLALVGAFVSVGLSILIGGRALVIVAWALTAAALFAVVVSWGSLTSQAFPSSRFASRASTDGSLAVVAPIEPGAASNRERGPVVEDQSAAQGPRAANSG
jgi:hypothetical protein